MSLHGSSEDSPLLAPLTQKSASNANKNSSNSKHIWPSARPQTNSDSTGDGKEHTKQPFPFSERIKLIQTIPHVVALISLLVFVTYVSIAVRSENARQLRSEYLAGRCAFVYLTSSNRTDMDNLGFSIQSLNKYFMSDMKYKIVIVHEDIPPVERGRLQSLSEVPILFQDFQLEGPPTLNLSNVATTHSKRAMWGHENIVRFWFYSAMLAEHSRPSPFADLDYIVRLDSDSAFTNEINKDVIRDFVSSGAQYGYQGIGKDCDNTTFGLKTLADSYVEINGIRPRSMKLWEALNSNTSQCVPKFESRFEIINLLFFRSHAGIQDWIKVVDASGGIFRHRWNGAALRYITVAIYAAPEKVVEYGQKLISYRHPHQMGN